MNTKNCTQTHVGIDTSQSQLDIFVRPLGEYFSYPNTPQGAKDAAKKIASLNPKRVLIEATGRLELEFVCAAHKRKLPVVVCNSGRARDFSRSIGRTAKTDKLDAQDIAHFGEVTCPPLTPLKPEKLRLVSDLLTVRRQLLDMSTMQKNRLTRMPKTVHTPLQRILKSIQKEIASVDEKIDKLVDEIPQWQEQRDLLLSAKGVGDTVSHETETYV